MPIAFIVTAAVVLVTGAATAQQDAPAPPATVKGRIHATDTGYS